MPEMLEIRHARAGYGAINVLWDVSLAVAKGEVTTIVGPNGAGKTTLLRAIMGLVPLAHGEIAFDGAPLAGVPTWDMAQRGIAMVPEGRMIFRDMSIEENLMLGAFAKSRRAGAARQLEEVYGLFPLLKERRALPAGTLSGGQAQMLALGRGLMSSPQLMLIDEPSLGLAPVMVQEVFAILERLKAAGRTIVLVEQNTHMALRLADQVYLMQGGKVTFEARAKDVNVDELHDMYFAR
ncbi:branched-chain amino acid transport system ATP-binding protein [Paraburkholderia tropica]|uniref:Amino acid/amide ABC transporter ATP-binding protein 2 (HAAT family) n=2 Tax=Paraburkholderia tropica TaxID=92647 RepID=A0AAQ1GKZ3_9BURK|nr:ABC transporter ATP-binding protein [Paraburkholderia tropica]MBB3002785.1 branched-chain amino acid transport system ATP-binding protein [Paraburkholderia tropica]MBB6321858.1 branched-chain amino acid transport system ATP-binding protein [Paraburkholderia tropica]PXX19404.1 amino acid/amide ABC transporter ATP-binding protein 2 (HAAT family) [Paraburkholderia tropica]PZW88426.1 amino acid/amide ABC transporter ATP-binding protein 2 (HAAT family) [Paraburkholderia tropica]SEK10137.1 amino 